MHTEEEVSILAVETLKKISVQLHTLALRRLKVIPKYVKLLPDWFLLFFTRWTSR